MLYNETSIFSIAHTDTLIHPISNKLRTIRVFFQTNIKARSIRVVLSNKYGDTPLKIGRITLSFCDEKGEISEITDIMKLRVNGENSFAIPPMEDVTTDKITLFSYPGQYISINIYYPEDAKIASGNLLGDYVLRSVREGDFTESDHMLTLGIMKKISHILLPTDMASPLTSVKEVYVETEENPRVVAVLGDSLTQQGTWINPLREKLYKDMRGEISICNLGIGGNRLCKDSPEFAKGMYGEAGVKRFGHSVTSLHGLTHVIIALGTNDIGLPGKDGVGEEELIKLRDYILAQTYIVNNIKEIGNNIKIYVATLLPRKIQTPYTKEREMLRREINHWIRNTDIFDYVLDYDKFAYLDEGKGELRDGWYLIDGLHLSERGGKELSEFIPIDIFR